MTDTDAATEMAAKPARYGWVSIAVAIIFGILYAYVLWDAIGNLVQLPRELDTTSVPWGLLILDVSLPVLAYAGAFLLGLRRSPASRALLFFMGLTLLACCTVGSIAFVQHT